MTTLELELFTALKEIEDARLEEENYRFIELSCFQGKPSEIIRDKWKTDLRIIGDRNIKAHRIAQDLIKRLS